MSKSIYHFGIFFLGLAAAGSLFLGILQLRFGMQLYTFNSFIAWFLALHTISVIATIFLLKYYYNREYWAAFYTGIASTITSLGFAAVSIMLLTSRALLSYYIPMLLIALGGGIIYALSITFSITRKKFWLRMSGAYLLAISLILLSITAWALIFKDVQVNITLGKIFQWTSIAACLTYIPLLRHFLDEVKLLTTQNMSPH